MNEKEDMNKTQGKMSLLTKIIGAVVLVGVTFTTCSCNSNQKYTRVHPPEQYFQFFNYSSHMQLTPYDPLPLKSGISNN